MIKICHIVFLLSLSSLFSLDAQGISVPVEAKIDALLEKVDASHKTLLSLVTSIQAEGKTPAVIPDAAMQESPLRAELAAVQANTNYAWVVLAAALVFVMQAGFAMVELGFSRAKNSINIIMKNFLDFSISTIVFMFLGFGLMFGSTLSGWIGTDGFWLSAHDGNDPLWVFWFFQAVFAGTACTIVSGAMAERTKFVGYLVYAGLLAAVVYPIGGHWAWGSFGGAYGVGGDKGWLEALGFIDFAGSTVVHGCGGAAALAGILVVGARHGRFGKDGSPRLIAGHNIPLAALGVFILWFGWFGFNAGSTLMANASIGRIAVSTVISPAAAALFAMISMWFVQGRPDVGITLNGALGGAVGVTACCANISPASALVVGMIAGIITTVATIALERLQLDDAVGAVPVHLCNGWWGTLSVALFDDQGFKAEKLGVQALGTFSITLTAFVICYGIFKTVDMFVGLRATDTEQMDGLDFSEHSANAYPDFQTTEQV